MLDGKRKSIQPMATRLGNVHEQALNHFVTNSPWDPVPVRERLAHMMDAAIDPEAWVLGSNHLDVAMGAINTVVLLCSSLTMVLAVRAAQVGSRQGQVINLVLTIVFGLTFLVVKYFEYAEKFEHHLVPGPNFDMTLPQAAQQQLFFSIYFMMTGVHGVHVLIGIGILIWIWIRNNRGEFSKEYFTPVDIAALYWHLVDLIWIYLFPLLYLI